MPLDTRNNPFGGYDESAMMAEMSTGSISSEESTTALNTTCTSTPCSVPSADDLLYDGIRPRGGSDRKIPDKMWLETPCLHSLELSEMAKRPVYLKMENCQATGSFKDRGIGLCIKRAYQAGYKEVVAVSAGNAGLAAAHAATLLGMPVTVCVPAATTQLVLNRLKREGAAVRPHGENLQAAAKLGKELAEEKNAFLASPYDHPDIWDGHTSMIEELKRQLPTPPGAICCSVGGGGLIMGVILGIEKVGWSETTAAVGLETEGTASFNKSYKAGKVVGLEGAMNSIAKSIAVYKPTMALEKYLNNPLIVSDIVTDAQAAHAVIRFADDHRFLVEPAAGVALSFVYSKIVNRMTEEGKIPGGPNSPVVIIVCGGNAVTLDMVDEWKKMFMSQ